MTHEDAMKILANNKFRGVRYNVVRRPLAGGKNTIVQHKPTKSNPRGESREQFYARLQGLIRADPSYYFMRWMVQVTPEDLRVFQEQCLNPILEQLCDWWKWIAPLGRPINPDGSRWGPLHWRSPFGAYSVLAEGGAHELDEFLATGSRAGLMRETNLFPELS